MIPQVIVLGTGSPLYMKRAGSSFLVNQHILLDAPASLSYALHRAEIDLLRIDTILISHFHGDHFVGLPFLLLAYDVALLRTQPFSIVGPPGLQTTIETLYDLLYPGFARRDRSYQIKFVELPPDSAYSDGNVHIRTFRMNHGTDITALGFQIVDDGLTIGYTGDTAWCDAIFQIAENADALIVDCNYAEGRMRSEHLSVEDIRVIRERIALSTHIILTHINEDVIGQNILGVINPSDNESIQDLKGKVRE